MKNNVWKVKNNRKTLYDVGKYIMIISLFGFAYSFILLFTTPTEVQKEVVKYQVLDENTGKYHDKYKEVKNFHNPNTILILILIVISFISLATGAWMYIEYSFPQHS